MRTRRVEPTRGARERGRRASDDGDPEEAPGRLGAGYLALVPMLAAYEWARSAVGGGVRNSSELALTRLFSPLGAWEDGARIGLLAILACVALVRVRELDLRLGRTVFVTALQGLAAAILLGPILVFLVELLGDSVAEVAFPIGRPEEVPGLPRTALVFGSSAWEELFFRLGAYSLLYLLVRRCSSFLGASDPAARWSADVVALTGSSLFFAAAHLEGCVRWLGEGGEPFHSGLFAWRAFAGVCLGVLFRWRGVGVAGWAHGLFNVALMLGAGPAVFL